MTYSVYQNEDLIASNISIAGNFFTRLVGLLNEGDIDNNEGLLIYPCSQVHTFGMKYEIDIIFLSEDNKILYIESKLPPGKISQHVRGSKKVLELNSGVSDINDLYIGKTLNIIPNKNYKES